MINSEVCSVSFKAVAGVMVYNIPFAFGINQQTNKPNLIVTVNDNVKVYGIDYTVSGSSVSFVDGIISGGETVSITRDSPFIQESEYQLGRINQKQIEEDFDKSVMRDQELARGLSSAVERIEVNEENIEDLQGRMETAEETLVDHGERIETLEQHAEVVDGQIEELQEDTATALTKATNAENIATSMNGRLTTVEEKSEKNRLDIANESLVRRDQDNDLRTLIQESTFDVSELEGKVEANTLHIQEVDDDLAGNYYTKAQVDAKVVGMYNICGTVDYYEDLPENASRGDVYNVKYKIVEEEVVPFGMNYVWDGEEWDELGDTFDMSQYRPAAAQDEIDRGKQAKLIPGQDIQITNNNVINMSGKFGKTLFMNDQVLQLKDQDGVVISQTAITVGVDSEYTEEIEDIKFEESESGGAVGYLEERIQANTDNIAQEIEDRQEAIDTVTEAIETLDESLADVAKSGKHNDLINRNVSDAHNIAAITGLQAALNDKQPTLTSANAGSGISITGEGSSVKIVNTQTSAEWGNIEGDIDDQTDLKNKFDTVNNNINTVSQTVNQIAGTVANLKPVATSGVHNDLTGRDGENCHPMSAITGLEDKLEEIEGEITTIDDFVPSTIVPTTTNFVPGTSYDVHEALQRTANLFGGHQGEIDDINEKIPSQATSSNQLADKAFVNSTVASMAADFCGNFATWSAVPTQSSGYLVEPGEHDYMVVEDVSDYPDQEIEGKWRFVYSGDWDTDGKDGWTPAYSIGSAFTAAQQAAIDSGITSTMVNNYVDPTSTASTAYNSRITAVETDKREKIYSANKIYGTDTNGGQTAYSLSDLQTTFTYDSPTEKLTIS